MTDEEIDRCRNALRHITRDDLRYCLDIGGDNAEWYGLDKTPAAAASRKRADRISEALTHMVGE